MANVTWCDESPTQALLSSVWRQNLTLAASVVAGDSSGQSSQFLTTPFRGFLGDFYESFVLGSKAYQSGGVEIKDGWQLYAESLNMSDILIFIIGTSVIHSAIFWGFNGLLYLCYQNNWFAECKIQGATLPSGQLYRDCLYHCFVNHCIVGPLTLYFGFPFLKATGMSTMGPVPPPFIFIRDIVLTVLVNDTLFYWGHVMLHHKSIYKYVHKQHHKFKINMGISSEYAHPVEHLFSNIVPVAGIMIMGSHVLVFWLWLAIRIGEIVDTHSGFEFKYSPYSMFWWQGGADRHEFHHSHNVGCYGSFTAIWDAIMGTDEAYNKYRLRKMEKRRLKLEGLTDSQPHVEMNAEPPAPTTSPTPSALLALEPSALATDVLSAELIAALKG